ncbi:metallophosphoesterase [Lacihabitans sp. CS3-21]|uniref:metallophosphoesterase n=1 Tax=Lacihabitans sp. CS3-21 TaxID=2487332 RepID=UPI0020CC1720|nr:metallophosphoesterase [Lacihabitans sp. CS3-21]MCP9748388.1 metallophosphoesterase [Lacihabitans sp. CS3-21]
MDKITIIQISDIHYEFNEPETQGLILSSFFIDLDTQLDLNNKDNTYCVISGDLVNKGNSEKTYNDFYENFILKILKRVPIQNIFCIPGNHDLNRKEIEDNLKDHNDIIEKEFTETGFNNFIKEEDNIIHNKFKYYKKFYLDKLQSSNFNLNGFPEIIAPEITLYFLNCSLLCYGGLNKINDKGRLKIETSGLNEWISENQGRTKILVMHHPLEYLTSFARNELNAMLKNGIDIIISGHIHDQELLHSYVSDSSGIIKLGSPQLFSNKADLNGYSLINFENKKIESISYREWVPRQRKFMAGQNFSGTENGKWNFKRNEITTDDFIFMKLNSNFQKAMKSYSQSPKWVERYFTSNSPNSSNKSESKKLDYINIINSPKNYHIIAAPQFGLTCYAQYLALKAWEIKKESWLYLDTHNWTFGKYHSDLEDALTDLNIEDTSVRCLLLDHWKNNTRDSRKIIENIRRKFPEVPIIIFSNYHDNIVLEGLDSEESHEGFSQIYLCELNRQGLRNIVKDFNSIHEIAEENLILQRLDVDLIDLNIHRTPINCIQLLIAFLSDFEDRPINRSKVFKNVLKVVFDNPGNLFYGDTIDEDNCGFIVGYFCEELLKNNQESFTESHFLNLTKPFCEKQHNTTNVNDLLQILKNNQIIVNFNGSLRFRFSYWIYYFAALRMKYSEEFKSYMLGDKHSLYYPEVIEFYTGIDGRSEDIVIMLISDLDTLSKKVHTKLEITGDINPYKDIKWALNETVKGMTQEQLEQNIQQSGISEEIKDIVADKNYDSVKPYTQTIYNYFEEYDVKNLMSLIKSSSRALRNSEFVKPELREELLKNITVAWKALMRALYLISPVMAKNGFGGVGGARFKLSEDFPKEYNECLKSILIAMPFNLNIWFKDDLFSDKLRMLFRDYRTRETDLTVKHILALMECYTRPKGWKKSILDYIGEIGKNSFYLGNLYTNLRTTYSTGFLSSPELKDCEYLIKACWIKHNSGSPKPGIDTVAKVPDNILPQRDNKKIDG